MAGPVLKPVSFRSRGKNITKGNRGLGLYFSKYGKRKSNKKSSYWNKAIGVIKPATSAQASSIKVDRDAMFGHYMAAELREITDESVKRQVKLESVKRQVKLETPKCCLMLTPPLNHISHHVVCIIVKLNTYTTIMTL